MNQKMTAKNVSPIINSVTEDKTKNESLPLKWDDYFMGVAFLSAQRSKDPKRKVHYYIIVIYV